MAIFLYRLGKASYRRAGRVLLAWLAALVAIGGVGFGFAGQTDEEFRIPGSESQEAFDRLEAVFPAFAGASAQAVLVAPDGERLDQAEYRSLIIRLTGAIDRLDGVEDAVHPFEEFAEQALSADASTAFIQIQFDAAAPEVTDELLDSLLATRSVVEGSGLTLEFGGTVFQDQQVGLTIAEVFGVMFAGLVLIVTFRSVRPAWMPLASAIIGVGIILGILFFSSNFIVLSSSSPLLAVMLGLAVGIDYSLFILSRHRTQLAAGEEPEESAAIAVGTAGNAVVFAGVTVIVALLGLFVVGLPFLSVLGASAAAAVAIAVVAAITLLPALMGLTGEKLRPQPGSAAARIAALSADTPSMGRRWARLVAKHPLVVTLVTVLGLGGLALPALSLDLNLPGGGQEPEDSTQRKAYDLISEGFGPGYNGPLLIAVDITRSDEILDDLEDIEAQFVTVSGVDYVSQGFPSPGLDTAIFQIIPDFAPDSPETKALVADIRQRIPDWEERFDAPMAVTGVTAIGVDVSERIQNALLPFGVVVVGLSIVLLLAVFRSVVVPLKAALGFVLSVTAAFGVVVVVFQWGYGADLLHVTPGPILSFMPIILMAVLFGLAMDYQVFLVSGMREVQVHTGNWRHAIEEGYSQGARVVTAAALIMFFVFFSFVPEGSNIIKPIALGLAVGIAFDAFVVRMTLVPALMALFGSSAWWLPRWLDRRVPRADVEGELLRDHVRDSAWAAEHPSLVVHASYLTTAASNNPVSLEWPAGKRVALVGEAPVAVAFAATVAGYTEPRSGTLHIMGHALPGDARTARQRVSVWSQHDNDLLEPLGDVLAERQRFAAPPSGTRRATHPPVPEILSRINRVSTSISLEAQPRVIDAASRMGALPRTQQIVVSAAIALADRAPVTIISPTAPVSHPDEIDLWWRAISELADTQHIVALCVAPPARALELPAGIDLLDLSQPLTIAGAPS